MNRLSRLALDLEKQVALEQDIADFFAVAPADRVEHHAFELASLKSWARD
jgi:hypothetical protein